MFLGSLLTVQLPATCLDHRLWRTHCGWRTFQICYSPGHPAQQCKQQNCLLWIMHQHDAVEAPAAVQYVSSVPQLAQHLQSPCWCDNKSHGQCCGLETLTQSAEQSQSRSGMHVDWGPHYDHLMKQSKRCLSVRLVSHILSPFKNPIVHGKHTKQWKKKLTKKL